MATYNFEKLYFLVVDDNRHMRMLISNILRGFGVRYIFEAEDGSDAIRELRSNPIDIVICDWVMEPLDGFDFVKLIRSAPDSPNPFVPIIILSGYTEHFRITGARDAAATEFLAKPVSAKTLFSRIASIIDHPRPFVNAKHYKGPDRRRHASSTYKGLERRGMDNSSLNQVSSDDAVNGSRQMSQDDLDALFAK